MILGISGKRGVGKTTAANYLVKRHKYIRVSFAEELRRLARHLFPFTEADMKDIKKKESPFLDYPWSPRDFHVGFGEFMRYYDKDYWCKVAKTLDPKLQYVIDDLRFENEFETIKKLGGRIIRINRYEKNNPYGKNLDIISETALDGAKFDYVVEDCRNTSLGRLHEEMEHIVTDLTT